MRAAYHKNTILCAATSGGEHKPTTSLWQLVMFVSESSVCIAFAPSSPFGYALPRSTCVVLPAPWLSEVSKSLS